MSSSYQLQIGAIKLVFSRQASSRFARNISTFSIVHVEFNHKAYQGKLSGSLMILNLWIATQENQSQGSSDKSPALPTIFHRINMGGMETQNGSLPLSDFNETDDVT